MEFVYFYNRDGERFSYYMMPKILVTSESRIEQLEQAFE
ncbi:hypothetical protein HMPREF7215_0144 [Pyramidobacter piscolens W5455]|uniref:Uncharacterized protein n=1 Tax=Pyramidobacter piscolens W5455 TaxID=352165 RepID=A0ABM9ZRA1_9BACT|nr:hypothetical protein HMPREF7215_0144 [Pyramidobacter piscolens W5455]